jgi:hypothetical protein
MMGTSSFANVFLGLRCATVSTEAYRWSTRALREAIPPGRGVGCD